MSRVWYLLRCLRIRMFHLDEWHFASDGTMVRLTRDGSEHRPATKEDHDDAINAQIW